METIKVNMTPCEDIKTIHASQNDNEAREWGFELHNNGEKIDSSSISDQLVFKAYEGGTEEILPENGSTPTTSPFKGDIRYPQGLLTDQEFLYRESPTEEDGLAKITEIKGNTLVWNQQIDSSQYRTGTYSSVAVTKSADETYLIANGTASAAAYIRLFNVASVPMISGHKYCCIVPTDQDVAYYDDSSPRQYSNQYSSFIFTSNGNPIRPHARINSGVASTNRRISFMMFDLTQMGLDSLTVEEFTSLFPLPYYSYNQGTLLSFMGNGIKTVGFNLFDQDSVLTSVNFVEQSDGSFYIQYPSTAQNKVLFENKLKYSGQFFLVYKYKYANTTSQGCRFEIHYTDGTIDQLYADGSTDFLTKTFITKANKVLDYISGTYGSNIETWWKDVCINISNPSKNGTYEPYTSSTLSLPISTYFPTGMKSAGSVYDELTPSNAITRIGAVDLGSLTWTYDSSVPRFYTTDINTLIKKPANNYVEANAVSSMYVSTTFDKLYTTEKKNMTMAFGATGTFNVMNTSYSDANAFKTAMSGVYLYYELATPTETSFTTASLVTENAEIPLSNEDGVLIGKCTEELSSESGFFDAKIKLADEDGECYSNKIQLHIERSPQ